MNTIKRRLLVISSVGVLFFIGVVVFPLPMHALDEHRFVSSLKPCGVACWIGRSTPRAEPAELRISSHETYRDAEKKLDYYWENLGRPQLMKKVGGWSAAAFVVGGNQHNDLLLWFRYRNLHGSISVDPNHPKLPLGQSAEEHARAVLEAVLSGLDADVDGVSTRSLPLASQYWKRKIKPTLVEMGLP